MDDSLKELKRLERKSRKLSYAILIDFSVTVGMLIYIIENSTSPVVFDILYTLSLIGLGVLVVLSAMKIYIMKIKIRDIVVEKFNQKWDQNPDPDFDYDGYEHML